MLTFKPAGVDEAEALSDLAITSKGYWGYPEDLLELWGKDLRIRKEFIQENVVRTINLKSELIGFFGLRISRECELEHMWLLPAYIGKGYGKAAFEEVQNEFRRLGITKFFIVSDPNAEKFYISQGARRVGEVESKPQNRFLPKLRFDLS